MTNLRPLQRASKSGRRSRRAAYTLSKMGFAKLALVEGGMAAWEAAGLLEAIEF